MYYSWNGKPLPLYSTVPQEAHALTAWSELDPVTQKLLSFSLLFLPFLWANSAAQVAWTWSLSLRSSHQLSVTSLPELGTTRGGVLTALTCAGLVQQRQQLWLHGCSCLIMSGRHCFAVVLASLWLLQSFPSCFRDDPWLARGGVWYRCPMLDWVPQTSLNFGPLSVSTLTAINCTSKLPEVWELPSSIYIEHELGRQTVFKSNALIHYNSKIK